MPTFPVLDGSVWDAEIFAKSLLAHAAVYINDLFVFFDEDDGVAVVGVVNVAVCAGYGEESIGDGGFAFADEDFGFGWYAVENGFEFSYGHGGRPPFIYR